MSARPLVIYHDNCPDGFAAALAAWLKLREGADYLTWNYDRPGLPDVRGRDVVMLDFSFKRMTLQILADQAASILLLDHHESAKEDLAGFACKCVDLRLDLEQSGAVLAWKHFHPGEPVPFLFQCIQDRDLWQWKVPGSAEYLGAVDQLPRDFAAWAAVLQHTPSETKAFADLGAALHKQFVSVCEALTETAIPVKVDGLSGWAVNCPLRSMASDAGERIGRDLGTFALLWRLDETGQLTVSVRSPKGMNMRPIAERFGGGGHPSACSFRLPLNRLADIIAGDLRSDAYEQRDAPRMFGDAKPLSLAS